MHCIDAAYSYACLDVSRPVCLCVGHDREHGKLPDRLNRSPDAVWGWAKEACRLGIDVGHIGVTWRIG